MQPKNVVMLLLMRQRVLSYCILLFPLLFIDSRINGQNLGFYFERDQKRVTVPFELHNNLIILPITFNEKYPLKFILDTGVRSTILLDKEFMDALGIKYQRKIELFGIGDTTSVTALVAGDISLSMPGIKSSEISILVLERDFLNLEKHLGTKIHGIIGYELFSRFVIKIDYLNQKIVLYQHEKFKANKKYDVIDLDIYETKPYVNLPLQLNSTDSVAVRLMVDTGASHALILNSNSHEKITIPKVNIETKLGRGLTGEINGRLGRIEGLQFGKKRLVDVIVSFPDQGKVESIYQKNGSIGGELLKKYTVIFDFFKGKMYLKSNATFKYPFEYNMSGLEFLVEGENLNQFVIHHIREKSAASGVGFETGDLIVSLNNIPARKLTLTKIYTNLNLKNGKKINLTVSRDGKYISKSFSLRREI